jgi:GT2 family glycosyltransferase
MVHNMDGSIQNCYGKLPDLINEIAGPNLLGIFNKPWGKIGRYLDASKTACKKVDRVAFACTLTRRTAQQEIGELDERFTFYSEDFDWFKRLQLAGWSVLYCPSAHVKHHWGASSSQRSNWAISQLFQNKRLYFLKHFGTGTERLLRIGLSFRFLIKVLIASLVYLINPVRAREQIRRYSLLLQDMIIDID